MSAEEFTFAPAGQVKIGYAWASKSEEYESGRKKYSRKRIHAKKTYSFTVRGLRNEYERFVAFYNRMHGELFDFYFTYDGVREKVFFNEVINPTTYIENGRIVAFSCVVGLEVIQQRKQYPAYDSSFLLPKPRGNVSRSFDWNTQIITMGATQRRNKSRHVWEKFSANWSGLKPDRDKIIDIFNSACRRPVKFFHDGNLIDVILPDSIEITDLREAKKIVGYKTSMTLEVVA